MKVITPGHEYELDSFGGGAPQTIRFINKKRAGIPKGDESANYFSDEGDIIWRNLAKGEITQDGDVLQAANGQWVAAQSGLLMGESARGRVRRRYDPDQLVMVHNGTTNEEVLSMLIDRMNYLQGLCPCRENAIVITKLEESLMWLNKRTAERTARNVEGKHIA
jgi:hypothetical protein